MPVETDPLASLASWPVEFKLDGWAYSIAPQPATTWLIAILEEFGSFAPVIELLSESDRARIEQAVIDEQISEQELEEVFRDVVEAVAGRPWWVVLNYLNLIRSFWARFHGRILFGLNPELVPLGAYLDAAHYVFIEGRDEQTVQKIINFLETPPPGLLIELDQESEGDTFLAMMNQTR